MHSEIRNGPDYASLHLVLEEGEQVITEAGAMMGMSPGLKMSTDMKGGLMGAAKRAMGGESVFLNTYTATAAGQRLDIAPASPGDLHHLRLENSAVLVQSGSYCACTPGVDVDSKWAGARGFFAGEGLVMLRCHGTGDLWISSYGAIHRVDVEDTYVVDTTHIVAFEESLTYTVRSVGGMKSLLLSGEGRVCEFSGRGALYIQTRSVPALAAFLHPFRRVKAKS